MRLDPIHYRRKASPSSGRIGLWDIVKLIRSIKDMERLKSRKLWVTVFAGAVTIFAKELGIDPNLVDRLVGMAAAYVLGQSYVDGRRVS